MKTLRCLILSLIAAQAFHSPGPAEGKRAQLYASKEMTGLGLFDRDGKPRAALTHRNGWSGCFLKDHGGAIRVGLALDAADGPRFVIQDEAERPLVSLP